MLDLMQRHADKFSVKLTETETRVRFVDMYRRSGFNWPLLSLIHRQLLNSAAQGRFSSTAHYTAGNLDLMDLTESAEFDPIEESFIAQLSVLGLSVLSLSTNRWRQGATDFLHKALSIPGPESPLYQYLLATPVFGGPAYVLTAIQRFEDVITLNSFGALDSVVELACADWVQLSFPSNGVHNL